MNFQKGEYYSERERAKANILYVLKCVQVNCNVSAHVAIAKSALLRRFSRPICENGDIITRSQKTSSLSPWMQHINVRFFPGFCSLKGEHISSSQSEKILSQCLSSNSDVKLQAFVLIAYINFI